MICVEEDHIALHLTTQNILTAVFENFITLVNAIYHYKKDIKNWEYPSFFYMCKSSFSLEII